MNKDINIMLELQGLWDKILESESIISITQKSIDFWKEKVILSKKEISSSSEALKKLKNDSKTGELNLLEIDTKIKKLDAQQYTLKNQKEVDALNNELTALKSEKNNLEESLIGLIDNVENCESRLKILSEELIDLEKQSDSDISVLETKIEEHKKNIMGIKSEFDLLVKSLNQQYFQRFQKLLGSKGGKAIVLVNKEVCAGCNFSIPASLANDCGNDLKVVNCTNCGRFLYR
jgi:predicted  nucleic acid-binding Zn-ribbon protein